MSTEAHYTILAGLWRAAKAQRLIWMQFPWALLVCVIWHAAVLFWRPVLLWPVSFYQIFWYVGVLLDVCWLAVLCLQYAAWHAGHPRSFLQSCVAFKKYALAYLSFFALMIVGVGGWAYVGRRVIDFIFMRFFPMFSSLKPWVILVLVGLPVLYYLMCYLVVPYLILVKQQSLKEAFKMSLQLVMPHWFQAFIVYAFVIFVLMLVSPRAAWLSALVPSVLLQLLLAGLLMLLFYPLLWSWWCDLCYFLYQAREARLKRAQDIVASRRES